AVERLLPTLARDRPSPLLPTVVGREVADHLVTENGGGLVDARADGWEGRGAYYLLNRNPPRRPGARASRLFRSSPCTRFLRASSPRRVGRPGFRGPRGSRSVDSGSCRTPSVPAQGRHSMRPLGLVQGRARVLGQVRVKEFSRLRDGQAQIVEVLQLRL